MAAAEVAFEDEPNVAEHPEGMVVVLGNVDPHAVETQPIKGFIEEHQEGRGTVVVVPQVLAADEDEELGFFEGPFDNQLTLPMCSDSGE